MCLDPNLNFLHRKIALSLAYKQDLFLCRWSETFLNEEPVHISHLVNYNITSSSVFHGQYSFYEPFYISPNTIPFYDERFVGYGFTRNSQVSKNTYKQSINILCVIKYSVIFSY